MMDMRAKGGDLPDDRPLWDGLLGMFGFPAISVCCEIGVYEHLARGPASIGSLAEQTGIPSRHLRVLLTYNEALGLLGREASGDYFMTPSACAYLLRESPTSFRPFMAMVRSMYGMYSPDSLLGIVRSNRAAMYEGKDAFQTHEQEAALARSFTQAMHGISAGAARAWPAVISLAGSAHLLDLGGGSGIHAIEAVKANAKLRATVLDLATVCEVARETIEAHGVSGRVSARAGELFSGDLPEADVHFYSMIFHDWPAEACQKLAQRSFAALPSGGRILLHEMLLGARRAGPAAVAAFGVSMLFGTQGEQYSGEELGRFLAEAGFQEIRITPTLGYWAIVEGRRP